MLRTWLVLLLMASICGCTAPNGRPSGAAPTELHVHVVAYSTCPPGTTCGFSLHEIAGARVLVDGALANTTDSSGRAGIGIPMGSHNICATHPDYGAATATVPAETKATLEMWLQTGMSCG